MDINVYIDHYLAHKYRQRREVFEEAASTSLLMLGVKFLCQHFYHLFDWYSHLFLIVRLRLEGTRTSDTVWRGMGKYYADAIDTYHLLWVFITFFCYWGGWRLWSNEGSDVSDWCLWIVPLVLCVYRIFEILASLIEMYFRNSESKHHQFRILVHAFLFYLSTGFAFALFYVFTDWGFETFSSKGADGEVESQFGEMFEAIYTSMLTVVAFSGDATPQDWIGKVLNLMELFIGFILATFIFMNITQVWAGDRTDMK